MGSFFVGSFVTLRLQRDDRTLVAAIAVWTAFAACGEREPVARITPPPAPQPAESGAVPTTPDEGFIEVTEGAEPIVAAETRIEPAALIPDGTLVARLARETEFDRRLRQLEFEAVQNAPQFGGPVAEEGKEEPAEPALFDELNQAEIPEDFNIAENREARLRATESDLPLVLNKKVVRLINYFTGRRGRNTFKRTIERSGAYRAMIERVLEQEGVPLEIFHLAQAESGFRPKAVSRARAKGMWQFISYTGRQYGLRRNKYMDERYDPELATRAAARHLKDLHIEFNDWYLAMAAYNGGPNRVRRGIKSSGSRDYWELSRRRFLRRETRNYVPIILAMTYVAKNDWLYESTEFDWAPPLRYDTVEIESEIHIDLIAEITDINPATIRELNPALLRSATPPMDYRLRLPHGSGAAFEREIALIPHDKRLAWRRYQVKAGDTVAGLAGKFNVKSAAIAELNGIEGDIVPAGLRLTIPGRKRAVKYYYSGAGGFLVGGSGRYQIARGDTLGGIARRYGTSVARLKQWNGLSNSRIIAGRYLIVAPEGLKPREQRRRAGSRGSRTGGAGKYKIRRGDNLSVIAKRFGVAIHQLRDWNDLIGNRIRAGRYLIVRDPSAKTPTSAGTRSARSRTTAAAPLPPGGRYRIRQGDTLSAIADRFGVSVADLRNWNDMRGSRIRAGKDLIVGFPRSGAARQKAQAPSEAPKVRTQAAAKPAAGNGQYRIRRGDTLEVIARRFGVTVQQLKQWNGLRSSRIRAGKYLTVRPGAPAAASVDNATRYKIRPGDTLAVIARRFGVTIAELKAWNGLRTSRIRAGKYLTIYSRDDPKA